MKKDLAKLKAVWTDKKQDVTKGDVTKKPEAPKAKPEPKKPLDDKKPQEPPEKKDQEGDEEDERTPQQPSKPAPIFKKKSNPFVKKDNEQAPEEED